MCSSIGSERRPQTVFSVNNWADQKPLRGSASYSCEVCIKHCYFWDAVEALKIADDLEPLARKIGDNFSVVRCLTTRAWAEFGIAPDLAKLEIGLGQLSKYGQSVG